MLAILTELIQKDEEPELKMMAKEMALSLITLTNSFVKYWTI